MALLKLLQEKSSKKVLLLGSGGLSIGQAGEFDYSGTQAIKAMVEEGLEVILINPNIATVQTNPMPGVTVYLYPVEPHWVEKVIIKERPTAIVAGFGGQTALNCLLALDESGVLDRYSVANLGTQVPTLRVTEDRDLFAKKMRDISIPIPPSIASNTLQEAIKAAENIGYPVIVRAAYALGGLGSGFASNQDELEALVRPALASSPQVLVEKSLKGWKEVEYEVMRDREGNTITICNMENFDPLGIHTGDSIVVCPSQSLSDDEYQILRNAAIRIVDSLGIVGECNVQYALDPTSHQFYVIEVNARLSRSSALASKASGYPIAYIAAKVVLGYDLLELKNPVTGITYAFFEPALDYVTVKIPRWDLAKFRGASRLLGSTMKSVGEVMSIGRTFPEALQKAVRMVTESGEGLSLLALSLPEDVDINEALSRPTDTRLYYVYAALRDGMDLEKIASITSIDRWFLAQLLAIVEGAREIGNLSSQNKVADDGSYLKEALGDIDADTWRQWKLLGFGDEQVAGLLLRTKESTQRPLSEKRVQLASLSVREMRLRRGVRPVAKRIDTTAAEYPSPSNYWYLTYAGSFDDPHDFDKKSPVALVLGSGAYRIGTSVEFDWCAVSCSKKLQHAGWQSIIVNCNPETVSTDYNSSTRLYFEELTLERILDIAEFEKCRDVIASMGGQLPNRLAPTLAKVGLNLLGHSATTVDKAENRREFSALLDRLGIEQPRWVSAANKGEIEAFVQEVGFPILVRPSYVLSGAAMKVAYDQKSLDLALAFAIEISSDYPVVISEFYVGAHEIELDGVARNGEILTSVVSEHVENAGVHSGDASVVVPAQKLYVETVRKVRRAAHLIAEGLVLNGPFNIQFLARANQIKVIECNARAARSFPFVSKVVGLNLADVATDVMIGIEPEVKRLNEDDMPHVGVKAAMFSFTRLAGADPVLGVEMTSTGEVGCIGQSFDAALLLALEASKIYPPKKGVLVSAGPEQEKFKFLPAARALEKMGLPLYATRGTAEYLRKNGIAVQSLAWPGESEDDALRVIRDRRVDLVINIPKNHQAAELTYGSQVRQTAAAFGCSLITNMEKAVAFIHALGENPDFVNRHVPLKLKGFVGGR